jgi:tRNA_anti-like
MAIIPCRECAHQVSDQAASCPSCGAPLTAAAVKTKPLGKRVILRVLIALMTLWTLATVLWLVVPSGAADQLITRAQSSLQHPDRGIESRRTPNPTQATYRADGSNPNTVPDQRPASVLTAPSQPAPALRPVYRTTAEQLNRDYETNAVATQTKIGASRVQLTGNVAEIDQDATGRPFVKLWTGKDSTAVMTLAEDQRAAAAHLAKGEAVEVGCDQIRYGGGFLLHGIDCTLAFFDARPKEVNLAVLLGNDSGATRSSSNVARTSARKKVPPAAPPIPIPVAAPQAVEVTPRSPATSPASTSAPVDTGMAASTALAAEHATTNNIRFASASTSDTGTATASVPAEEVTVAHAPQSQTQAPMSLQGAPPATTSAVTTATLDDLASVRAADPQAADHIATYCANAITSANRDTFRADCRRREAEAWTRLVLQNEFPTLGEATRKKCSEPPFPDTYVAKESCARYELHMN